MPNRRAIVPARGRGIASGTEKATPMTQSEIKRLNQIFGDKLGLIPAGYPQSGEPIFQYKFSRELVFPFKTGVKQSISEGGLIAAVTLTPVYELQPQLPNENCFVIAQWTPPGHVPPEDTNGAFGELGEAMTLTPDQWKERYPDIEYPWGGWWYAMQPLRPGYVPDENWTRWAADHLDWQGSMTLRDTFRMIMSSIDRREQAYNSMVRAATRQCFVNHIPGARGGSYLAFNEKPERTVQ